MKNVLFDVIVNPVSKGDLVRLVWSLPWVVG